ncbi:MAG: hypothetical protein GY851_07325 [bacterium]|nr:hypothetical protein [bacterium]
MDKAKITKALAVANRVCGGADFDREVLLAYLAKLSIHSDDQIVAALDRCMSECSRQLSLKDILERLDDGWLDPQAAWMLCPETEDATVVWCPEIAESFEVVRGEGDKVAARMAFIEVYSKRLAQARAAGARPEWGVSLGLDPGHRERALRAAVDAGRLEAGEAVKHCPQLAGLGVPGLDDGAECKALVDGLAGGCNLIPGTPLAGCGGGGE